MRSIGSLVCLRAKVGTGRSTLGKVAGEDRLNERAENNLSAAGDHDVSVHMMALRFRSHITRSGEEPSTRREQT